MSIATPTSGYTFRDLVIRVAEYLGVAYYGDDGDEAAQVPQNTHDIDLCKRLVNDGIKMFIASNRKWYWMQRTTALTIDSTGTLSTSINGDAGRYIMPPDFNGDATGEWAYAEGENTYSNLDIVPESTIRRLQSLGSNEAGPPYYAAFRPLDDRVSKSGTGRRWEVVFYPKPGESYEMIYGPYRAAIDNLIDLDIDYPVAGNEMDEAILAACLAKAELDRDDVRGARNTHFKEMLAMARTIDLKSAPKTVGKNLDGSGRLPITSRHDLGYHRPTSRVNYKTT